jgi:hypothetical protein
MLGGRATITVVNRETGHRVTYRITRTHDEEDPRPPVHFVRMRTGHQEGTWAYLGKIRNGREFHLTQKSERPESDPDVELFRKILSGLVYQEALPRWAELWHDGTCGACGRMLTVPASISRGFGPECGKRELGF